MLYFNRNGVWFSVPIAKDAVYDRDLLEKQVHSSLLGLQNLKERSGDIEQMRFEKPGEYVISSAFGTDKITIIPPIVKRGGAQKYEAEITGQYTPAIEVYDVSGAFKGVLICHSGTFEPPYEFISCTQDELDEFLWGQWKCNYGSIPFTERKERVFYYEEARLLKEFTSRTLTDIPNIAQECIGDADTDGTTSTQIEYTGTVETNIWCRTAGPACEAVSVSYRPYTYLQIDTNIYPKNLLDDSFSAIEGARVISSDILYISTSNPTRVDDNGLYYTGGDCGVCIAGAEAIALCDPPAAATLPWKGSNTYYFYSGTTYEVKYDNFIAMDPYWSNYIDLDSGGFVSGIQNGSLTYIYNRTNGALGQSDETIVETDPDTWLIYGVSSSSTSTVFDWQEGAFVDGVFYEFRSGAGEYSYDVADKFNIVNARYWKLGSNTVFFMSSGERDDASRYTYFHVNKSKGAITGIDFDVSHTVGSTDFHSIPGHPNLFGKGYFRLVRVHEEVNKTIDVPA